MKLYSHIDPANIVFYDALSSPDQLYADYAIFLKKRNIIQSDDKIKRLFVKRENVQSTAIGKGMAIPHIFSEEFQKFTIGMAVIRKGMPYKAPDHDLVYAVFLIMSDERSVGQHLKTLAYIAKLAQDSDFISRIRAATDADDALQQLRQSETAMIS